MKRKKIAVSGMLLLIALFWGWRVWEVNRSYPEITEQRIAQGDWVDLSGCKLDTNSAMDGYELMVMGREFLDTEEFLTQSASEEEREEYERGLQESGAIKPERICLVHVKLRNHSEEESEERGVNWNFMKLFYKNRTLDFDKAFYTFANPSVGDRSALSLRPGTEMDFYLPYRIYRHLMGEDTDRAEELPFCMVVSLYPTMVLMEL